MGKRRRNYSAPGNGAEGTWKKNEIAVSLGPPEKKANAVKIFYQIANDVRQIGAFAAEIKKNVAAAPDLFTNGVLGKARRIGDGAARLGSEAEALRGRPDSAGLIGQISEISDQVAGKLEQIAQLYERVYQASMENNKIIVEGARVSLMDDLGMDKRSAYEFTGIYPVKLAHELVGWLLAIPDDVGYGDILAQARAARQIGDTSAMEKRFKAIPRSMELLTTLDAIIFIAESFKPRDMALEEKEITEAKASA